MASFACHSVMVEDVESRSHCDGEGDMPMQGIDDAQWSRGGRSGQK